MVKTKKPANVAKPAKVVKAIKAIKPLRAEKKVQPIVVLKSYTPLLAGQRRPGMSFHLPPKMANAMELCEKNGKPGSDFAALSKKFGPHVPTTLVLLGFLELSADQKIRCAAASEEWMRVHRAYRKGADVPANRQAEDLSAEREQHVLKLCQGPKDYEAVTRVCGDVSTLHLIETELLEWITPRGEKRPVWQRGEGRLQTTDKGMESLASRRY